MFILSKAITMHGTEKQRRLLAQIQMATEPRESEGCSLPSYLRGVVRDLAIKRQVGSTRTPPRPVCNGAVW